MEVETPFIQCAGVHGVSSMACSLGGNLGGKYTITPMRGLAPQTNLPACAHKLEEEECKV